MNVKDCYDAIGGDYEDVKKRFLSDARIKRFALLFLEDTSMEDLRAAMRDADCGRAFRAAHTLKGVCLNLGFTGLYLPVNEITDILRAGEYEQAQAMMPLVEEAYTTAYDGLKELAES